MLTAWESNTEQRNLSPRQGAFLSYQWGGESLVWNGQDDFDNTKCIVVEILQRIKWIVRPQELQTFSFDICITQFIHLSNIVQFTVIMIRLSFFIISTCEHKLNNTFEWENNFIRHWSSVLITVCS